MTDTIERLKAAASARRADANRQRQEQAAADQRRSDAVLSKELHAACLESIRLEPDHSGVIIEAYARAFRLGLRGRQAQLAAWSAYAGLHEGRHAIVNVGAFVLETTGLAASLEAWWDDTPEAA